VSATESCKNLITHTHAHTRTRTRTRTHTHTHTPLSTVISNSSANHRLYANDRYTQRFLSSSVADVAYNVSHLEHTISKVYNWMSSNFLSLNPSRTEFFLLVFLDNSQNSVVLSLICLIMSLSPVHSAPNVGIIFDSNLTLSEHNSAVSKSYFYHISYAISQWRNCIYKYKDVQIIN
jgi:hypothetical protein